MKASKILHESIFPRKSGSWQNKQIALGRDDMKAEFIIDSISHDELDKEEEKILRKAVNKIKDKRSKNFLKHLKEAAETVNKWPKWKQRALGELR